TAKCSSPCARNSSRPHARKERNALTDFTTWIHGRSPITVAAFMDAALYHPDFGYYARAVQRSGRAGDFFTSVDVGPLFGELLAKQIAEMVEIIANLKVRPGSGRGKGRSLDPPADFDLVEAG